MFKFFIGNVIDPPPLTVPPISQNPYPDSRPSIPTIPTVITKTGLAAIDTAVAGDVISITGSTSSSFTISNKHFSDWVVIWANEGALITASGPDSAGIVISNCSKIILRGFEATGATVKYGIHVDNCTDVILYDCHTHNNQEIGIYFSDCEQSGTVDCLSHDTAVAGIALRPVTDNALNSLFSFRDEIYNTGKGLYIGNSDDPTYGPLTGVYVEDCYIHDTTDECIDLKSNVEEAIILRPRCENGNLLSNGLITIGSENESTQGTIILDGARTRGVTNRGSLTANRYHLVVGRGDVIVRNCALDYDNEASQYDYGISLFRTSVNQVSNNVTIEDSNSFGAIRSQQRIEINVNSAGLAGVDNPVNFIIPINSKPALWLDATDDATLISVAGLTEWRDKSGRGFDFKQETEASRPAINTRQINGRKAVEWNGDKFMTLPAFTGPQILLNSMFFAVFDSDVIGSVRILLSLQQSFDLMVGFGIDPSGFFFSHSSNVITNKVSVASATGVGFVAGYRDGTTQYIVDRDGVTATNALGTDQRAISSWSLGAAITGGGQSSYFDGAIGEIKVYDYYSAATFASEMVALKTKWGIT